MGSSESERNKCWEGDCAAGAIEVEQAKGSTRVEEDDGGVELYLYEAIHKRVLG